MSSYHAWTHRPKAQGGTDPIEGSTIQWVVLKDIDTGQEFTDDDETTLLFQHVVNDYPAVFETPAWGVPGPAEDWFHAVTVLQDGLYSIAGNLRLDELTVGDFSIDLINIDPAGGPRIERETYIGANSITGPIVSGGATWGGTWRLAAGETIYSILYNHTGSTFNSDDDGGAFFEVRFLGPTTVTGRRRDLAT